MLTPLLPETIDTPLNSKSWKIHGEHSAPHNFTSASSLTAFGKRLKTNLFSRSFSRSSIAFPNHLLARLHGYLTIAGVGTSLMKFSLGSVRQIKLPLLALGAI